MSVRNLVARQSAPVSSEIRMPSSSNSIRKPSVNALAGFAGAVGRLDGMARSLGEIVRSFCHEAGLTDRGELARVIGVHTTSFPRAFFTRSRRRSLRRRRQGRGRQLLH